MRIRTQLLAAIIATLGLGGMAAWLVASAAHDEFSASETQARAQTASHEVSGLLVLTQEYARHSEGRSAQQWHQRHAAIATVLAGEEAGAALKELRSVTQALPHLFNRLEELPADEAPFTLRRKEVLIDQLLTSTQAMSDLAYQWYQEVAERRRVAAQRFQILALITPLAMLALLIGVAVVVRQRVLGPLGSLTAATSAVASGDLGVRVAIDRQDEFGELSRRFDQMTMALARSEMLQAQSEQRVRSILRHAPDAFISIDSQGRIREWNRQAEVTLGWTKDEVLGRTLDETLIPPEHRHAHNAGMKRFASTGEGPMVNQRIEITALHKDGHVIPIELSVAAVNEGTGYAATAFLRDITQRKQAEALLHDSERQLRQIADNLPVLISYIDKDQRMRFANETYRSWLGADPLAVVGTHVRDVLGPALYELRRPYLERALGGERVEFEIETAALGVTRTTTTSYIPKLDPDGSVQGIYALSSDVTALKNVERQLQALARFDTVTGLPNRLQFNEKLPDALARAHRTGGALALMYLDVDHFKSINDTLGHAAGDAVLREFAARLVSSVRTTDTVARLAGDEFAIILEGLRDRREVQAIAQKIIDQAGVPMQLDDHELRISTSVGVAFHERSQGAMVAELFLAKADEALYAAKAAGRGIFRVASASSASAEAGHSL